MLLQERFSALLCSACSGPLLRTSESPHRMACIDCGHRQNVTRLIEAAFKAHALFSEGLSLISNVNCTLIHTEDAILHYVVDLQN
jgi:hypothetical protein